MAQNKLSELDKRITALQGELEGLLFARKLMIKDDIKQPQLNLITARPAQQLLPQERPSVRYLIGKVVSASEEPLTFSEIKQEVERVAGGKVNRKTVSSSLNFMKEKGMLNHEQGAYSIKK